MGNNTITCTHSDCIGWTLQLFLIAFSGKVHHHKPHRFLMLSTADKTHPQWALMLCPTLFGKPYLTINPYGCIHVAATGGPWSRGSVLDCETRGREFDSPPNHVIRMRL